MKPFDAAALSVIFAAAERARKEMLAESIRRLARADYDDMQPARILPAIKQT